MKRLLAGAFAGVSVLALSVGCAKQIEKLEPKLEIQRAAEAMGESGKSGFTLKAGGSVDDLIAAAKKDAGTGKDAFTDEDADILRKVYNSSLSVAWDKGGAGAADDKSQVSATIDGVTGTEVRYVGEASYVKVPVSELASKFGASQADVNSVKSEMGSSIPGIDTLIDGGWVSVSMADFKKLAESSKGAVPSADPAQNDKLVAELKTRAEALINGAQVVRDAKDDTHLTVTTSTVQAFEQGKELVKSLESIGGKSTSGLVGSALGDKLDKAPADKPIVFDMWIDEGEFKAFEINFLQFVEGSTGRASLRVEMTGGTDITAPADAKKIDLSKILKSMTGAMSGGGSAATTSLGLDGGDQGGSAKTWAEVVGSQSVLLALSENGKPAAHLQDAADKMTMPGVTVKVVRKGVAEVTSGGSVACVTVPSSTSGKPKVVEHAC